MVDILECKLLLSMWQSKGAVSYDIPEVRIWSTLHVVISIYIMNQSWYHVTYSIQSCRSCYARLYLCQRPFYKICVKYRNSKIKKWFVIDNDLIFVLFSPRNCFVKIGFISFCIIPFRFGEFRFDLFRFASISFRFVSVNFVPFDFVSHFTGTQTVQPNMLKQHLMIYK